MRKTFIAIALLITAFATINIARTQDTLIDDIETSVEPEWGRIRIRFTLPINYERHFPKEHGQLLQIFFTVGGIDSQRISISEEVRKVSATPVLPATTLTYEPPLSLNLQRDPSSLSVRFDRPVSFDVRPGEDSRSLVIYLPIAPRESKPLKTPPSAPANPSK